MVNLNASGAHFDHPRDKEAARSRTARVFSLLIVVPASTGRCAAFLEPCMELACVRVIAEADRVTGSGHRH